MSRVTLNYPLFDGEKIIEDASVVIEDGIISSITHAENADSRCLLMPGLIDAHTHMTNMQQVREMLRNGIAATCDVSAPPSLAESSGPFVIISSAGMTMGTLDGRGYVKKSIENGAEYIKVLLFEPNLLPVPILKSICKCAHENGLKVAVHATSVKSERMAVNSGADILLHVPMKEELPKELAEEIAECGIAVAPTLIMMETFAHSGRNGYLPEHYINAQNAVRTLHDCGVTILAATDANIGSFAPAVSYGNSLHKEMQLLCKAGLSCTEVLQSATKNVSEVFGIGGLGSAAVGKKAALILLNGRPDKDIAAVSDIRHFWINGEQII